MMLNIKSRRLCSSLPPCLPIPGYLSLQRNRPRPAESFELSGLHAEEAVQTGWSAWCGAEAIFGDMILARAQWHSGTGSGSVEQR
eukprot:1999368-Rhodomonas_salina.1